MMYTNCPLCKAELKIWDSQFHYSLACESCAYDGMSKFRATYTKQDELISKIWWIDDFYIQIDYRSESTSISKIDVCILFHTFVIPRVLVIDEENPHKIGHKLRTLMVFS